MNQYLSISKFAALCGTTKDALVHYDEVGLLHPVKIDDNHYRYYSIQQVSRLENIRLLSQLGIPLDTLKTMLDSTPDDYIGFLKEQHDLLEYKKNCLEQSILQLDKVALFDKLTNRDDIHMPVLFEQRSQEAYYTVTLPKDKKGETGKHSLEEGCRSLLKEARVLGISPFPMIACWHAPIGKEPRFTRIGCILTGNSGVKPSLIAPPGKYAALPVKGNLDSVLEGAEKCRALLRENGLTPTFSFTLTDLSFYGSEKEGNTCLLKMGID